MARFCSIAKRTGYKSLGKALKRPYYGYSGRSLVSVQEAIIAEKRKAARMAAAKGKAKN